MKKAALHNLGCKVNAYETEAMQQLLEEGGYEIVPFTEAADVYVINTCSVTNMADRKSRQMIHRARKQNEQAIVVAAGCYVQTSTQQAKEDLALDIIIGNNKKNELVHAIDAFLAEHPERLSKQSTEDNKEKDKIIDINDGNPGYEEMLLKHSAEHTRAFIKVQDGCNQFCSYCIIPFARGRVRSRNPQDAIREITGLAKQGYQEVVLTGIHLSSYGMGEDYHLIDLIEQVNEIDGIKRIRLGSLEPQIITEDFVKRIAALDKMCPHFHLSLQSGCDATLRRMNRKYTAQEYQKGCELLRKYFQHPAITTDVIVGFPGETQEEFQMTKAYLKEIHFYEMHVFKYSKRQGTKAATMEHQVLEEEKTKRSSELLALEKEMSEEFRRYYLNHRVEALMEEQIEYEGESYFVGYTREYVKVAIKTHQNLSNAIVKGTIVGQLTTDLFLLVEF